MDRTRRSAANDTLSAADDSAALAVGAAVLRAEVPLDNDLAALDTVAEGRYEVRRELARGGMGRILEAWDVRNRREVAIKMLLDDGVEATVRFLREARITARLQHPSIVPLYEVARFASGEPFYAMKLVDGASLATVVGRTESIEQRIALLPHLIATTEALAYAHSRNIVHRDLKPSNVLVGAFGETVVIDWGLAKSLDAAERDVAAPLGEGDPIHADLTAIGQALGTPSYMPPEQARGGNVDTRSDVYALGALLYFLLAGAPPYSGASSKEVIGKVLLEPPPPLPPELPADLVAIVTKAMAREASARYATANEMAVDLRRFATGQLVSAHRYSMASLVARWAVKHRALLAMAAALVVAVGITAGLSVRRIVRERDRADQLKVVADEQRRAALARRDAAEGLAEFMVAELRQRLAEVGRLDVLAGVGARVDGYYRAIASLEDGSSPQALARRATALSTLAEVSSAKDDFAAALPLLEQAIELRERVRAAAPGDRENRALLVEDLLARATAEQALTQNDASLATLKRAVSVATELASSDANDLRALAMVARAEDAVADQLASHDDMAGALAPRYAVRDALLRVTAASPDDLGAKRELADTLADIASLETNLGHLELGIRAGREALDAYDDLVRRKPDDAPLAMARSGAVQMIANAQSYAGELEAALSGFRACADARRGLVARDPQNDEWQRLLGYCVAGVADMELELNHTKAARGARLDMLRAREAIVRAHPENERAHRDLVLALDGIASVAMQEHDDAGALAYVKRAQVSLAALMARDPSRDAWKWIETSLRARAARARLSLGDVTGAAAEARAALEISEALAAHAPDDDDYVKQRGVAHALLAQALAARGDAAARAEFAAAFSDFEQVHRKQPEDAECVVEAAEATRAFAKLLTRAGEREDARRRVAAVVESLEELKARRRLSPRREPLLAALRAER